MENSAFAYRAVRSDGAQEVGVVEAVSREAALHELAARGLFPIDVRLDSPAEDRRTPLSANDLALGLRSLAMLLEAGLPVSRALAAMDELAPRDWQRGLPAIREAVRRGERLSAALRAAPLGMPRIVLGIIQAGEAGSDLVAAVRRAAELTESTAAVRAAVRSALAYPAVLAVAGIASVGLLVGVVLPRFAVILSDLGQDLPRSTQVVLDMATLARAGAVPGVLGVVLSVVAWRVWTSSEEGLRQWHALLLAVPAIGAVRWSSGTARCAAAVAALLESGVPIAPTLSHAAATVGDAALATRLRQAREAVVGGQGVARALDAAGAVTPTAVRLIRTGEETGRLAVMFAHASRLEAQRTERIVRSAVRLLEPTMILAFAGIVALVAAALLQAVYGVGVAA